MVPVCCHVGNSSRVVIDKPPGLYINVFLPIGSGHLGTGMGRGAQEGRNQGVMPGSAQLIWK